MTLSGMFSPWLDPTRWVGQGGELGGGKYVQPPFLSLMSPSVPIVPSCSQASEHNVSHEAMAIKRMLELGLLKNLTYF